MVAILDWVNLKFIKTENKINFMCKIVTNIFKRLTNENL